MNLEKKGFGDLERGNIFGYLMEGSIPTSSSIRKVRNNFMATATTFLSSISLTSGESRFSSRVKPSQSAKNP